MAHISDFPNFIQVCSCVLNIENSKKLWINEFYINSEEKKWRGSQIYLIVVDDRVVKLGCGEQALSSCQGYPIGNSGKPSIRTTGIHYYIADCLKKGKEVKFYVYKIPCIPNCSSKDLFGNNTNIDIRPSPKQIEKLFLDDYKNKYGILPEWNKQEQGRAANWEEAIKNIHKSLRDKEIIPFEESHRNNNCYMLYHWKYNNMEL